MFWSVLSSILPASVSLFQWEKVWLMGFKLKCFLFYFLRKIPIQCYWLYLYGMLDCKRYHLIFVLVLLVSGHMFLHDYNFLAVEINLARDVPNKFHENIERDLILQIQWRAWVCWKSLQKLCVQAITTSWIMPKVSASLACASFSTAENTLGRNFPMLLTPYSLDNH